jgi:glycosyltransferase involved in cell wall biosynthesis
MRNNMPVKERLAFFLPGLEGGLSTPCSILQKDLPTVIVEAMALGAPIVSTDWPSGTCEILRYVRRKYNSEPDLEQER